MRKIIQFLICNVLICQAASSQESILKINQDKYRINLPDYWGKGNKVWQILNDKLPLVCEELAGKDLCGDDCNPKYTVDFFMTVPVITDYSISKINPAPGVSNSNTRIAYTTPDRYISRSNPNPVNTISSNQNNNSNNTWNVITEYNFQCYLLLKDENDKILTRIILVDSNEVWQSPHTINLSSKSTFSNTIPRTYIENNEDKLMPGIYELLAIADKKMLAL